MIRFLIKGLLRDKSRSRLPVIVVAIGAMLTVLLHAYITGFMGDAIELNARFTAGHVKVTTLAYAENISLMPIDLALTDVSELTKSLRKSFPEMDWSDRIQFGGLIDAPDEAGETRSQGPAFGLGIDLLSTGSKELQRLNITKSMVRGNIPANPGDILISDNFAKKLGVKPGDEVTFIGSSMDGAMIMYNFRISGTVSFGVEIIDRGGVIADINDVRQALDMQDAASEIVGFLPGGFYDDEIALEKSDFFNSKQSPENDEFAPVMKSLSQQGGLGTYVSLSKVWSWYISFVFMFAMSLVLWNAGLLGGLRRYGEIGIRLAMGEEKGHVYRTMILESVFTGITGSVIGTAFGLFFAWLIQTYGIDIGGMMEGAAIMMPAEIRARITPMDYYIGFIPGLFSTVAGTMLAGIGIYKRQTARLFKELEA